MLKTIGNKMTRDAKLKFKENLEKKGQKLSYNELSNLNKEWKDIYHKAIHKESECVLTTIISK